MKNTDKKLKKDKKAVQIVEDYVLHSSNDTDPLGSYTGKALDPNEVPTQDADDL